MEYAVVIALILAVILFGKLKSLFFKAIDNTLVKEDQFLKETQNKQKEEINQIKEELQNPVQDLSPEKIEEFWKENKK